MPEFAPTLDFLRLVATAPIVDARSPAEFEQGHMPGAINIPLLNDAQRMEVGIAFKNHGRRAALDLGFRLAGNAFPDLADRVLAIAGEHKSVQLYCWRGGLRSQITGWILDLYGLKVTCLEGGYKSFRSHVLKVLEQPLKLVVVGGRTGTGKTEILQLLETANHQVIDLEKLACHKGSAFGGLGMPRQPTNEHFENRIAGQLMRFDLERVIYIENESRQLGGSKVPDSIYNAIRNAPVIDVQLPDDRRLSRIIEEYGHFPTEMLAEKTHNLEKRMGPQHVKEALSLLASGNIAAWADAVMRYYDKTYDYGMSQRPPGMLTPLEGGMESLETIAQKIVLLTPSITDTHTNPIY